MVIGLVIILVVIIRIVIILIVIVLLSPAIQSSPYRRPSMKGY